MERITIVIPHRETEDASITLRSLQNQTYSDFKVMTVGDQGKGANWARNKGFESCDTEFVLFSDNDIDWKENALEVMMETLRHFPRASYCYGRFMIDNVIWGHQTYSDFKVITVGDQGKGANWARNKGFESCDTEFVLLVITT